MSAKILSSEIGKSVSTVKKWNPRHSRQLEPFNYIDLSSVDQRQKSIVGTLKIHPKDAPSRARQLVHEGDILVSTVRPNLNGVAYVPRELDGATASTDFCVLRPIEKVLDGKYLFYWVQSSNFIGKMVKRATGASYPAISDRAIKESEIPLPKLAEQKQIAAILDKADAIRHKRRQVIQLADEFLRSVFLDMFGDPMVNPKGWPINKLSTTFSHSPRIGTIKPAKEGGKHIVIRVGELGDYEVALKKCKSITLEDTELKRFKVEDGDLLLARAIGSENHLGKASIFRESEEHVVFDSHVMKLKFEPKVIKPEFFLFWLKTKGGRTRFMRKAGKTAVQFNVNAKQISDIDIPLPPITLQATFYKLISQSRNVIKKFEKSLGMADLLFSSLTQRAFHGEL